MQAVWIGFGEKKIIEVAGIVSRIMSYILKLHEDNNNLQYESGKYMPGIILVESGSLISAGHNLK